MKSLSLVLMALLLLFPKIGATEGSEGAGGGTDWLSVLVDQARPIMIEKLRQWDLDMTVRPTIEACVSNLEAIVWPWQKSCFTFIPGGRYPKIYVTPAACSQAELSPHGFAQKVLELILEAH